MQLGHRDSIVVSIGAGILLQQARNQALWEGVLALVAAVPVATLIVHMWRTGRRMKANIEGRLESSARRAGRAAFLGVLGFTMLMITREGMETALLMNTLLVPDVERGSCSPAPIAGTIAAAGVAWLWSRYGHRVNLARFFQVTAVFLFVFVHPVRDLRLPRADRSQHRHSELRSRCTGRPSRTDRTACTVSTLTYLLVILPIGWLLVSSVFRRRPKPGRQPRRVARAD